MPEKKTTPFGDADPSPGSPLISPAQLQRMYELMLQYRLADAALRQIFLRKKWNAKRLPALGHPAVCAGLFSQIGDGDWVADSRYNFAANLAAGAEVPSLLRNVTTQAQAKKSGAKRAVLGDAAQLAAITGAALAQQANAAGHIVVAFPERETWLHDRASAAVLRWAGERRLPILYVTFARTMPEPGQSQSRFGVPQIAVDADDVVAVYRVAQECVHRARTGIGPTWIQCCVPAKSAGSEPLSVMQKFLEARGLFDPSGKKVAEKKWRLEWKQAWQAASQPAPGAPQSLPVVSFQAAK